MNDTRINEQLNSEPRGRFHIKPFTTNESADNAIDFELLNISKHVGNSVENAPLGKEANIVAKQAKKAKYESFRELAYAQSLLIQNNVISERSGKIHRTRTCHSQRTHIAETISLNISTSEKINRASLSGLITCASVWACPVCAKRIAMTRGLEIGYTIDKMKNIGYLPIMLTLTARHTLADSLGAFKTRFKAAWRKFSQSGTWQRLKKQFEIKHSIKAVEVTRTYENGWHYHQHGLLFIHADTLKQLPGGEITNWQDAITKHWLSCLRDNDLDGNWQNSVNIKAEGNIKDNYLAKLGLSDETTRTKYELTSGHNKDYKGRNIWTILRSAKAGNESDEKLYIEYVNAMTGDNWITYSHGLKDLVGLEEMTDEIAAGNEGDAIEYQKLMDISDAEYYYVRRTRSYAELLEIATLSRDEKIVRNWLAELQKTYERDFAQSDIARMKAQYDAVDKKLAHNREAYNRKSYQAGKAKKSFTVDFVDYMPEVPELIRKWRELRQKLDIKD